MHSLFFNHSFIDRQPLSRSIISFLSHAHSAIPKVVRSFVHVNHSFLHSFARQCFLQFCRENHANTLACWIWQQISRHTLLDLYWYEIFGAYVGTCIDMGSDTWIVSRVGLWINMLVDIHLHRLSVVMAISVSRRGPCGRCGTLQEFGYDYMTT